MKIFIAGQKWFGLETYRALVAAGFEFSGGSAPYGDRLHDAMARDGLKVIDAGTLRADTLPPATGLIVAAHSHDFIGEATRLRATYGGIGYHPSLLPLHRGRDAVEWAIRMGDRVTGGTVYRLSNKMDGGAVLAQEHVFVRPGDTARTLWERDLAPMGVRLLASVAGSVRERGHLPGAAQDEDVATWEPSIGRPPAFRPDLIMIGTAPEAR